MLQPHLGFTDTEGMLSQALLVGNFEAAVDICISADRMVSKCIMCIVVSINNHYEDQMPLNGSGSPHSDQNCGCPNGFW